MAVFFFQISFRVPYFLRQGLSEEVMEAELKGYSISQKAGAINSLLQQHRLQMLQGTGKSLIYKEVVTSDAVK
jgi:hypothetical protein